MITFNKNTVLICITAIIVILVYYWTNTADLREIKDYCYKAIQKSKDEAILNYEYCNKEYSSYKETGAEEFDELMFSIISISCDGKDGHLSAEEFKVKNDKYFNLRYSKCIMNEQEDQNQ